MIAYGLVRTETEVLLEDVTFHISESKSFGSALDKWSGYFTVSSKYTREAILIGDSDGPFYLVLRDGRKGQFDASIEMEGVKIIIHFQGNGVLGKAV